MISGPGPSQPSDRVKGMTPPKILVKMKKKADIADKFEIPPSPWVR